MKTTFDKIYKLMGKIIENEEEIDHLDFDVNQRDNYERGQELFSAYQKNKRLIQKLRKQMSTFLKENKQC